jgi:hypothetical protein
MDLLPQVDGIAWTELVKKNMPKGYNAGDGTSTNAFDAGGYCSVSPYYSTTSEVFTCSVVGAGLQCWIGNITFETE